MCARMFLKSNSASAKRQNDGTNSLQSRNQVVAYTMRIITHERTSRGKLLVGRNVFLVFVIVLVVRNVALLQELLNTLVFAKLNT
jgi:hypothetical protein